MHGSSSETQGFKGDGEGRERLGAGKKEGGLRGGVKHSDKMQLVNSELWHCWCGIAACTCTVEKH